MVMKNKRVKGIQTESKIILYTYTICCKRMAIFFFQNQTFSQFGKLLHYKLKVPGLAEKRPSVMRGDMIGAKSSSATPGSPAAREFEGKVTSVLDTDIIVRFEDERVQKM
jgi:hypothetical protein